MYTDANINGFFTFHGSLSVQNIFTELKSHKLTIYIFLIGSVPQYNLLLKISQYCHTQGSKVRFLFSTSTG
jgi:hypothetical protein